MIDIFEVPVPGTHLWAVVVAWIGCYAIGRFIVGGIR